MSGEHTEVLGLAVCQSNAAISRHQPQAHHRRHVPSPPIAIVEPESQTPPHWASSSQSSKQPSGLQWVVWVFGWWLEGAVVVHAAMQHGIALAASSHQLTHFPATNR